MALFWILHIKRGEIVKPVVLNVDRIRSMEGDESGNGTMVYMDDGEAYHAHTMPMRELADQPGVMRLQRLNHVR